ncbi:MAG TPA: histidine triad nucleotide-binding protein [Ignavibacteriaceae bacterium]|nr:histidine triad nucleotide-binding protein [Ignavibacteriaceae bacterium]
MSDTIFSKIIKREIKADIVFESDKVLAFKDINPQAPVHIIIVPKTVITRINNFDKEKHSEILAEMVEAANKIAKDFKIDDGFRLVINSGEKGGQSVFHLHMHLLGGRQMNWPPG